MSDTDSKQEDNCYVALTEKHLDAKDIMDRVRSPKAGAIVLFAGRSIGQIKDLANI
jgi:molybdopterin synthase catalytic subunit